jgi:hypothetical protein
MLSRAIRLVFLALAATSCAGLYSFDDFDVSEPAPNKDDAPRQRFAVKVSVDGLELDDKVTLTLNGADAITVGKGTFAFPSPIEDRATFSVAIKSAPSGYDCKPEPRSTDPNALSTEGVIEGADRTDVKVRCVSSDATLVDLKIDERPVLNPAFQPTTFNYQVDSVKVALFAPTAITVTAKTLRPSSVVTIAGQDASGGKPVKVPLKFGEQEIDVKVRSISGRETLTVVKVRGAANDFIARPAYKVSTFFPSCCTFGSFSSALAGNTLVVGAGDESTGLQNVGVVFVYSWDVPSSKWLETAIVKRQTPPASTDNEFFGHAVALSSDGETLVVGAPGDELNTGAVYVFERVAGSWTQRQRLRASNPREIAELGYIVAISGDTIVAGSPGESSGSPGINGNQSSTSMPESGAVYVWVRNPTTRLWTQQAYVKASNPQESAGFGRNLAIHGDTIAVGMMGDASNATGINGNQTNRTAPSAGAAYIFERTGTTWTQRAYVKASNARENGYFGSAIALSATTLAVGSMSESSNAKGVNGDQTNTSMPNAGALYTFVRDPITKAWKQEAYIKASNTLEQQGFGSSAGLGMADSDTEMLAVASPFEKSGAAGINGNENDTSLSEVGAIYVYTRKISGGTWEKKLYVKPHAPTEFLDFGMTLHVSGSRLVVGGDYQPGLWIF